MASSHLLRGTCLVLLALPSPLLASEPTPEEAEFFEKHIRPLLVARCFDCHGDVEEPEGELRLTSRTALLKGGAGGAAAVAGKPGESLLIEAVEYRGALHMPPDEKLPQAEIDLLRKWVEMGLPWPASPETPATPPADPAGGFQITDEQRAFWAFQPVGDVPPPDVRDHSWPRTEIDRFILARLEAEGLRPAPAADKRTLIRRATFDLTGLPPTVEEVEAFVADESPDAFARVVDRLLDSPQYGVRWGRHWLDVVRYTDSFDARIVGSDNVMDCNAAWRYRDWIVDAFNRDLPYDEFIVNQIAGDLLPASDGSGFNPDGIVATGMLALGNWGGGDADKEKLLTDIADDQVDVVTRGFLGLTVACARCHHHKFDPISTEDYYGLAGIFFSSHILQDVGPKTNGPPMLRIPLASPEELQRRATREARLAELKQQIDRTRQEQAAALAARLAPQTRDYLLAAWDYRRRADRAESIEEFASARRLHGWALRNWIDALGWSEFRLLTAARRDVHGRAGVHALVGETDPPSVVVNTNEDPAGFLTITLPPRSLAMHPSPSAGVAVAWRSPVAGTLRVAALVQDADAVCGNGVAWELSLRGSAGRVTVLAAGEIANGGRSDSTSNGSLDAVAVQRGDVVQLAVLPNAEYSCDTTVVDLTLTAADGRVWNLTQDVMPDLHGGNPHADSHGHADVWHFCDLAESRAEGRFVIAEGSALANWRESAAGEAKRETVVAAADIVDVESDAALREELASPRSPFQAAEAGESAFPHDVREQLSRWRAEVAELQQPLPPIPYTHGCTEGGVPGSPHAGMHDVHVHVRGRYDRLGNLVPRRFPVILAGDDQPSISSGSGRLELARWIASGQNPLTARVMINRIWLHHFGEGLVRSPGNFGLLGERPTHPQLLDWLARRFVESGWSIKQMHRLILLSAVYRQSSRADATTLAADPDNRLWGRMNRRRLEAEAIRDNLLAVAGRLDPALGGPAIRDLHTPRRTLYVMTIRSDASGFRELFDVADPTAMIHQRNVSTVAPQALFLLNDRFALEQSAALAARVISEAPASDEERIAWLYGRLYGRLPLTEEIAVGRSLLSDVRRRHPDDEPTVWEQYCQVLLCANEFVYVD